MTATRYCRGLGNDVLFERGGAREKCTSVFYSSSDGQRGNKYILLDVLVCSIAVYFYELCSILTSP